MIATRSDSKGEILSTSLKQALTHARAGASADGKGELAIAVAQYKEAIFILETEVGNQHKLPEEHIALMQEKISLYQSRIEILDSVILNGSDKAMGKDGANRFIEETPSGPLPEPPPSTLVFRPYWLMRVWARTLTSGGYLTAKVYLPKSLWYQTGCKFSALQTKVQSLEAVLDALTKLKEVGRTNVDTVDKELDSFCSSLDTIQNSLHFHLSFVAEVKKKEEKEASGWGSRFKKLGDTITKGAVRLAPNQKDEESAYISLLKSVFEESQYLEEWFQHFLKAGGPSNVTTKLRRVSDFFEDVVCQFVLRDLNILIERYLKKNVESFSKISLK
eukprot:TRINITY_DN1984_c0_g1_i1.p1 TRINITY_DN1984_c0_g1~~TRINITY_DN1984_c0_g1_i1.p1  ORF type:complete len:332 (+),score=79.80 TRINITY_DN1984_c0_g1_i1:155-1150(+)